MAFLHLDALPPKTTKGTIVRLVIQLGNLDRNRIGAIEVRGRAATVEVPDAWGHRLAKAIDGTNLANRLIRAWYEAAGDGSAEDDHLQHLMRLLDLEGVAEAEQVRRQRERLSPGEAEQSGLSLINLTVRDQEAGLGGRYISEPPKPRLIVFRSGNDSPRSQPRMLELPTNSKAPWGGGSTLSRDSKAAIDFSHLSAAAVCASAHWPAVETTVRAAIKLQKPRRMVIKNSPSW